MLKILIFSLLLLCANIFTSQCIASTPFYKTELLLPIPGSVDLPGCPMTTEMQRQNKKQCGEIALKIKQLQSQGAAKRAQLQQCVLEISDSSTLEFIAQDKDIWLSTLAQYVVFSGVIKPALLREILQRIYAEKPQIEYFYFESFEEYCSEVFKAQARNQLITKNMVDFILTWANYQSPEVKYTLEELLGGNETVCLNNWYISKHKDLVKIADKESNNKPFMHFLEQNIDNESNDKPFMYFLEQNIDNEFACEIFNKIIKDNASDNKLILHAFETYFAPRGGIEYRLYLARFHRELSISDSLYSFIIDNTNNHVLLAFIAMHVKSAPKPVMILMTDKIFKKVAASGLTKFKLFIETLNRCDNEAGIAIKEEWIEIAKLEEIKIMSSTIMARNKKALKVLKLGNDIKYVLRVGGTNND